ncbi:MAG: glycosyltransferase [Acetobacteraceae bacterium]
MPPDSLTDLLLTPPLLATPPRVLVWQWGRRGSPPRLAAALAEGLRAEGAVVALSLAVGAEVLSAPTPPANDLAVSTYAGRVGWTGRMLLTLPQGRALARRIAPFRPDAAICVMPGPMDLTMAVALRRLRVPFGVIVHDAVPHPGDGLPGQFALQRTLCRRAAVLMSWSGHVAGALRAQGFGQGSQRLVAGTHPPLAFGPPPAPAFTHDGPARMLFFGRFLRYKGLDLLAEAAARLGGAGCTLKVVGAGPETPALAALRAMPWVRVENRWVAEAEIPALLGWADAVVLPYVEATQSGVAAAALAAGRAVLATAVGGLPEQLGGQALARLCAPVADALAVAWRGLLADPPRAPPADAVAGRRQAGAAVLDALGV